MLFVRYARRTVADRLHFRDEKYNGTIRNQETVKVAPFEKWWRRATSHCYSVNIGVVPSPYGIPSCCFRYVVRMSGNFERLSFQIFRTTALNFISAHLSVSQESLRKIFCVLKIAKSLIKCINIMTLGFEGSLGFTLCAPKSRESFRRHTHNLREKKIKCAMFYMPNYNANMLCRTSCKI